MCRNVLHSRKSVPIYSHAWKRVKIILGLKEPRMNAVNPLAPSQFGLVTKVFPSLARRSRQMEPCDIWNLSLSSRGSAGGQDRDLKRRNGFSLRRQVTKTWAFFKDVRMNFSGTPTPPYALTLISSYLGVWYEAHWVPWMGHRHNPRRAILAPQLCPLCSHLSRSFPS